MRVSRRQVLQGLAAFSLTSGLVPYAGRSLRAETLNTSWPNYSIQVPGSDLEHKPPVVTAIAIRAPGDLLATAGDDHLVYVWNLQTRQIVHTLRGHRDWVHSLEFSPNQPRLASAGADNRVIFWDIESSENVAELISGEYPIAKIDWSADGSMIAATGFDNHLRIYNPITRALIRELECPSNDMRVVDFSSDDRQIAAGGRDGIVRIWNIDDGTVLRDFAPHQRRIRGLTYSPNGLHLVTAGEDRRIHVHSVLGVGEDFYLEGCGAKILSIVFFGPTQLATGCSDNVIRLWDIETRTEIGQLKGHTGSVAALACHGQQLISGSYDTTVRVWTIAENVARGSLPAGGLRTSRNPTPERE